LETLLRKLARGRFKWRIESAECKVKLMNHQNLQDRTKKFALAVIMFCEALPKSETCRTIGRQLLRSGCSVGANYRAACRAKSKADFISKMGIVLEEADESAFWIELLQDAGKIHDDNAKQLHKEATELVAIAISSINTARRNTDRTPVS
jgi:four helix bundle protein